MKVIKSYLESYLKLKELIGLRHKVSELNY
jgi:hypothetical protein